MCEKKLFMGVLVTQDVNIVLIISYILTTYNNHKYKNAIALIYVFWKRNSPLLFSSKHDHFHFAFGIYG